MVFVQRVFQRFPILGRCMSINVTQAVYGDLDELSLLFDQYRQFQGKSSDLAAVRSFLKARFDHGESVHFLARESGSCVGFTQLYPTFSSVSLARVFILNDLFVCEANRRKGVASKLLAAAEEHAISFAAVRLTLSVDVENFRGQALYEAAGWCRDKQYHVYHRFFLA